MQVSTYGMENVRFVAVTFLFGLNGAWPLQQFGDKGGDRRSLTSGQGDVGKEWVAFEGFDNGDHTIMAADSQVIALGNIVGHDYSGALANSGENRQQNPSF